MLAASLRPLTFKRTRVTASFPSVALPTRPGGLPIEVVLVAQLGRGEGTRLYAESTGRQRAHDRFIDALDEPSAKLAGCDFSKGDATSLYSFSVGAGGHPFHRHAGHRVFTAISGSGGALLRFSSATPAQVQQDPTSFLRALRHVEIPPDCLFTVRFCGENWHQFLPLRRGGAHPAFFALSTHTNELGGLLSEQQRAEVVQDRATIPSLTELLPPEAQALLVQHDQRAAPVPTTSLSLSQPPDAAWQRACRAYRSLAGRWAGWSWREPRRSGFVGFDRRVAMGDLEPVSADSLLLGALGKDRIHHRDRFSITLSGAELGIEEQGTAADVLAALLEAFLTRPDPALTRLMACRNAIVRPLKLRRSPLACPVSSLASQTAPDRFANRFPVYASRTAQDGRAAQVLLGADDRHLRFRTCVAVTRADHAHWTLAVATHVACRNAFGRFYMAMIETVHRRYVVPRMLEAAVAAMAERGHSEPHPRPPSR